ncbi:thrombospondin type 1 domain protein [Dictyocaulus viviparus]|uniref:Thrombospondin type 1 domain protein n=1 Tax=Dictyocaulus viviparus TaxID=29172 RepID=A0A0D8Y0W9_DICVI|nr:thrombospondin type 1 domain protein [Dictyocaulus viviparus]
MCQVTGSEQAHFPPPSSQVDLNDMHIASSDVVQNPNTYTMHAIRPEIHFSQMWDRIKPIVPVNIRRKRHHAASSLRQDVQCCNGPSLETRPCNAECEQARTCEWTEWSEWCGCTPCKNGKEIRRRLCKHGDDLLNMQYSLSRCDCAGEDTEERECAVQPYCKPFHTTKSPATQTYDLQQNSNQRQEDETETYLPISSKAEEFQTCHWSMWYEWSQCQKSKLRQRKRLCVGNNALIEDCKCMGNHFEEKPCDITSHSIKGIDEYKLHPRAEDEINSTDTKKSNANIITKMDDLHSTQNVVLSSSVTKTACEWTKWSEWSSCTVTCDSGKRFRTRRCGCGEQNCGAATTEEVAECSNWKCNKKPLPVFNVN